MRRALLIGSQTGELSGVHADVALLDVALTRLGFETRPSIGTDASTDGIVDGYRRLIEDTAADDVAVVYYPGHGGRTLNPLASTDRTLPTWLQYIVPTDHDDLSGDRVRCVLAEELSVLQRELTDRTRNVTVILDCCHSARMSRGNDLLPKANDRLVSPGEDLVRRWREARGALSSDANPHAVRLVACGPDQSAYESWNTMRGSRHGALTAALARVLESADVGAATWLDALEVIRNGVIGVAALQRPEVEGPADRLLFSESRRSGCGVLPVRVQQGRAILPDAVLFGVAVGDSYAVVSPGSDPATPLASAVVERIVAGHALLRLHGLDPAALPHGSSAWPVQVALGRRPVVVRGPAGPLRDDFRSLLERSVRLRPADDSTPPLATVEFDDQGVQVLDAAEQPLYPAPLHPVAATVVVDIERLALADQPAFRVNRLDWR